MKKPQSKLETKLSDEQQAQLAEWLLGGMKYHEAKQVVEKEFGLSVAQSAFSAFWTRVCVPHAIRRRTRAVDTSDEIASEAKARPGQFDAATIDQLKQLSFELSLNPNVNPKDVKALFSLVLKARDQDNEERRLQLDREKFQRETAELFLKWAADQRAKEIAGSNESNAAKIERLGQLMFGEDWKQ